MVRRHVPRWILAGIVSVGCSSAEQGPAGPDEASSVDSSQAEDVPVTDGDAPSDVPSDAPPTFTVKKLFDGSGPWPVCIGEAIFFPSDAAFLDPTLAKTELGFGNFGGVDQIDPGPRIPASLSRYDRQTGAITKVLPEICITLRDLGFGYAYRYGSGPTADVRLAVKTSCLEQEGETVGAYEYALVDESGAVSTATYGGFGVNPYLLAWQDTSCAKAYVGTTSILQLVCRSATPPFDVVRTFNDVKTFQVDDGVLSYKDLSGNFHVVADPKAPDMKTDVKAAVAVHNSSLGAHFVLTARGAGAKIVRVTGDGTAKTIVDTFTSTAKDPYSQDINTLLVTPNGKLLLYGRVTEGGLELVSHAIDTDSETVVSSGIDRFWPQWGPRVAPEGSNVVGILSTIDPPCSRRLSLFDGSTGELTLVDADADAHMDGGSAALLISGALVYVTYTNLDEALACQSHDHKYEIRRFDLSTSASDVITAYNDAGLYIESSNDLRALFTVHEVGRVPVAGGDGLHGLAYAYGPLEAYDLTAAGLPTQAKLLENVSIAAYRHCGECMLVAARPDLAATSFTAYEICPEK